MTFKIVALLVKTRRHTRTVRKKLADGQRLFPIPHELRPIFRNRVIILNKPTIVRNMHRRRKHWLLCRENGQERITINRLLGLLVHHARPGVDNFLSVNINTTLRTTLPTCRDTFVQNLLDNFLHLLLGDGSLNTCCVRQFRISKRDPS